MHERQTRRKRPSNRSHTLKEATRSRQQRGMGYECEHSLGSEGIPPNEIWVSLPELGATDVDGCGGGGGGGGLSEGGVVTINIKLSSVAGSFDI